MWLLVLACTGPEDEPSQASCPPEPGQILRLETGLTTEYLDAAIRDASGFTTLCLGDGAYETSLVLDRAATDLPGRLAILGSGDTRLVPRADDTGPVGPAERWYLTSPADELELKDLTFELPVDVAARSVSLTGVGLQGFEVVEDEDDHAALQVVGTEQVVVDGLVATQVEVHDQVVRVEAPELVVGGLTLSSLRSASGAHVELTGQVTATDWAFTDTIALRNEPGHPMVAVFGEVQGDGLVFHDNESNGPAITSWSRMDLQSVEIVGMRSTWTGALTFFAGGSLTDATLAEVTSGEGALALYLSGAEDRVALERVAFGLDEQANDRCDVSVLGGCILSEVGEIDELICDNTGCR